MRRLRLVLAAAAVSLAPVACGGDDADHGGEHGQQSGDAAFNESDVAFAEGMIPHHDQAVDMADLVADRDASPEVVDLAERIRAAQQPEIEMMEGWLEEWGHPMEEMDHGDMDMTGMGMASDEDMARLESASGPEFDRLFLTLMREHHEGAITMAERELATGQSPAAKKLAQDIIDAQQAEIDEIDGLLAS